MSGKDFAWQAVVAGVGGQGVLFATRVLAAAARGRTGKVLISEVHGMAQRGGSVVSHLKAGPFQGPLVGQGRAELVFALEPGEAVRNLPFLAPGGALAVNAPDAGFLSAMARKALEAFGARTLFADASALAKSAGSPRAANVALIAAAAAAGLLPFGFDELAGVVEDLTPEPRRPANREIFELAA
jgi:indolepyruvate ferredoxin oxidoreductase beta subunit